MFLIGHESWGMNGSNGAGNGKKEKEGMTMVNIHVVLVSKCLYEPVVAHTGRFCGRKLRQKNHEFEASLVYTLIKRKKQGLYEIHYHVI